MTPRPPVLAYVFWHRPQEGVAPAEYELALGQFHGRLRDEAPVGFLDCEGYRIARTPFAPTPAWPIAYEDWYLVEDWSAVGRLNDGAVDAGHRPPHDRVAGLAAHGVGGLYERRRGELPGPAVRFEGWSSKPSGLPSEAWIDRLLTSRPGETAEVWRRLMALGPAPEFCVRSRGYPSAGVAEELRVELRPVARSPPGGERR